MDKTAKQTALFFGFLAAAMTHASAQATPFNPAETQRPAVVERTAQPAALGVPALDGKVVGRKARRLPPD